ncbi:MAG: hypothetical protein JWQ40_327 [Segetibacter sp.]|nr:hypothetical protein [Segetibacter sp.]
MLFRLSLLLLILNSTVYGAADIPEVSIVTDQTPGVSVTSGVTKLTDALKAKNIVFEQVGTIKEAKGKLVIVAGLSVGGGEAARLLKDANRTLPDVPEALTIWKTNWQKKRVWVINGTDDRGLMYGLLDVADRVSWNADSKSPLAEVKEITEKPDASVRAISIYTMQRAYWESRFYDQAYWARYLDMLAKNRFNSLVVIFGYENGGFLAPCYPYFFDVEGYPGVRMVGLTAQEQQRNLAAINRLIDMCHERGIKFTVGIWDHIYRGGVQGGGIPGTTTSPDKPVPGLVWGVNSENLISYNKTALAKFVKMVPGLDAIQFRMHNESGLKENEQESFWSDVFKMLKATVPNLHLDLRAKELPEPVIQSAIDIGVPFRITTKYWMEQMGLPFHPTAINPEKSARRHSYSDMLRYPQQYKMHWRLWNGGTSRILLWGDPEFARRFAQSTHLYNGDGYEVNEPLATKMEAQPHDAKPFDLLKPPYRYYDYEFERYWHFFQVFGRIGYNPQTPAEVWKREFERRFGKQAAPSVEAALHKASWVLPRIISSSYPYSSFPTTRGWAEKQRLGDLPSFAKAQLTDLPQFLTFDEEAKLLLEGGETAKLRPGANSVWFRKTAAEINNLIAEAEKAIGNNRNKEFNSTITDLRILSGLALYHSRRIPAAVSYCLFERTQDLAALKNAIAYETSAIEAWRQIVTAAGDVYADDLMMGVRVADLCGNWKDELVALENGLAKLEQKRQNFVSPASVKSAPQYKVGQDTNFDTKFNFIHQPVTSAPVGKPITVNVKVNAPLGIKWVRLRYRSVNQEQDYRVLAMLPTGEKDAFQVVVPAEQISPKWDFMYYLEVMDNNSNGTIFPDLDKETPYIITKLIR